MIAKQLSQLLLVIRDAACFDHFDESPGRESRQGGFTKMLVVRNKVGRPGIHVCEIAAPTAGDQNLSTNLRGVIDNQHTAGPSSRMNSTHHACGSGADYYCVVLLQL
jgi:hypothetical protein